MKNIIALCGESASGKSFLLNKLISKYSNRFHKKISHTTRNPREGETDGEDYHFVSRSRFFDLVMNERMIEAAEFGGEMYGTLDSELKDDKVNIGIFDPQGLDILFSLRDIYLVPIYLKTEDKIRFKRALDRGIDIESIYERHKVDRELFDGIDSFPNIVILDSREEKLETNIQKIKLITDDLL